MHTNQWRFGEKQWKKSHEYPHPLKSRSLLNDVSAFMCVMTLSSTFATFLVEEEKLPTFLIETPSEMLSNTFMNLHLLAGLFPSLVSWESSLELFEAMVLGERNNTIGLCYMS